MTGIWWPSVFWKHFVRLPPDFPIFIFIKTAFMIVLFVTSILFFFFFSFFAMKCLREISPCLSIFILSSLFIFDSDLFLFLCFRRWHSLQPRQFIYPQNQPVCNYRVINTNWILQQSLTTPMTCSGNAMKWLQLIIILMIVLNNFTLYIGQKYTVDMT